MFIKGPFKIKLIIEGPEGLCRWEDTQLVKLQGPNPQGDDINYRTAIRILGQKLSEQLRFEFGDRHG